MSANTAWAGQRITAAWLNTNIPGPWYGVTLGSGITNGTPVFQARQDNSAACRLAGQVSFTAGIANGTVIGTLPVQVPNPANPQNLVAMDSSPSGDYGLTCIIQITTSGQIKIYGAAATCTQISFNAVYSLDA